MPLASYWLLNIRIWLNCFSQVSVGRESNIKEKLLFRVVENQFQSNMQKYNFFGIINDQQSRQWTPNSETILVSHQSYTFLYLFNHWKFIFSYTCFLLKCLVELLKIYTLLYLCSKTFCWIIEKGGKVCFYQGQWGLGGRWGGGLWWWWLRMVMIRKIFFKSWIVSLNM